MFKLYNNCTGLIKKLETTKLSNDVSNNFILNQKKFTRFLKKIQKNLELLLENSSKSYKDLLKKVKEGNKISNDEQLLVIPELLFIAPILLEFKDLISEYKLKIVDKTSLNLLKEQIDQKQENILDSAERLKENLGVISSVSTEVNTLLANYQIKEEEFDEIDESVESPLTEDEELYQNRVHNS